MIIKQQESIIETVGDIEQTDIKINPEDLDFIVTLLSSNQYSNPEESFIREIVSNAWDSHVAANNIEQPVLVRIKSNSVSVRDYGTGLSEEEFNKIYCSIGSSTKRDTNDFIGGFGIGKFASMACTDTAFIDDYYNGTCYHYIMMKEGNKITTTKIGEEPTSEHNGLEVKIDVESNYNYLKGLDNIIFFPNVYVDGDDSFNSCKIKHYKNFAVADRPIKNKILLGNVSYPLNKSQIDNTTKEIYDWISDTGIVIKFNIGELDVVPNREQIIYSDKTVKTLIDRINTAYIEILNVFNENTKRDFDDFIELAKAYKNYKNYNFITNEFDSNWSLRYGAVRCINYLIPEWTLFGKKYKRQDIMYLSEITPIKLKAILYKDIFYKTSRNYETARLFNYVAHDNVLEIEQPLTQNNKSWIKENYDTCLIIDASDNLEVDVKNVLTPSTLAYSDRIYDLIPYFVQSINKKKKVIKIPKVKRSSEKRIEKQIIHHYTGYMWENLEIEDLFKYLKSIKTGVVVLNKDDYTESELNYYLYKEYYVIWVKKSLYKSIFDARISQIMDKKKALSRAAVVNTIGKCSDVILQRVLKVVPDNIKFKYVTGISLPDAPVDSELLFKICKYNEYYKAYNKTLDALSHEIPEQPLFWYIFCKMNKLRLSSEMLIKVLNDPIVKLCKN